MPIFLSKTKSIDECETVIDLDELAASGVRKLELIEGEPPIPELQFEDQLPETITDAEYDAWYAKSWLRNGVRVGPKFAEPATPDYEERRENKRIDTIKALEAALDSAQRGYWGQCQERVRAARKAAGDWVSTAERDEPATDPRVGGGEITLYEAQLLEASRLLEEPIGYGVGLLCVAEAVKVVLDRLNEQTARANIWERNYTQSEGNARKELRLRAEKAEAQLANCHETMQKDGLRHAKALLALEDSEAQLAEAQKQVATLKIQLSEEYRDWMKEQCNEECRYGERLFLEMKTRAEKAEKLAKGIRRIHGEAMVRVCGRAEKAEADAAKLRQELGYIANAKRRNFLDGEDFRDWAQNRARHAIGLEAPEAAREGGGE